MHSHQRLASKTGSAVDCPIRLRSNNSRRCSACNALLSRQAINSLLSSVPVRPFNSPAVPSEPGAADLLSSSTALRPVLLDSSMTPPLPSAHHPVMRLISKRLQEGSSSRPGQRGDGFKLGLVVEGGGMRGIVTGAMLMGLQDMGLTHCFDAVYGASAGAINSTYFLTGQPEGLDIYTDYLATTSRFLSLKRYLSSSAVMNLDYLIDEIMHDVTPLDWQAVINSDLPLKVIASSLTSLRSEILSDFTSREDLVECLKASANVPQIVGGPRNHRGHRLVDAAVFEPLPIKAALRDGCTHILALCSRPHKLEPAWSKYISTVLTNGIKYWLLNPPYMREAWRVEPLHHTHRGEPFDDHLLQLWMQGKMLELEWDTAEQISNSYDAAVNSCMSVGDAGSDSGSESDSAVLARGILGGHVYPVYPGTAASFSPLCTHVPTLQAGRQEGYHCVYKLAAALEKAHVAQ